MEANDYAKEIVKRLVKHGYVAYYAGGWVRDFLMGHPSEDIDIATNAPPDKILDLFPHTILVGLAFGVVIVVIEGHQFEVSTFRKDLTYVNGRKPESVEFCEAKEDALRRDFTINGMFYDPLSDVVYDYVHGMGDIKKGRICTIGDPHERFYEDRLRMIRAIRFAARFDFVIDDETQEGILENANTLLPAVAMERIWNEFTKMAMAKRFDYALTEMHRLGLLPVIFPELQHAHLKDIRERVKPFAYFPPSASPILHLIHLFPQAAFEQGVELCYYLKASQKEIKWLETYFKAKNLIAKNDATDQEWVHLYADPLAQVCLEVIAASYPKEERTKMLEKHAAHQKELLFYIERVVQRKPLVTSQMLIEKGVKPGVKMGQLLKLAEGFSINEKLTHAEEAIQRLINSEYWR